MVQELVQAFVGCGGTKATAVALNNQGRGCRLWARVNYARWQKAEKFLSERGEVYPIKDAPGAGNWRCLGRLL